MKVLRSLTTAVAAGGLVLGASTAASAAPAGASTGAAPVTCTIKAGAPYLSGGLIKGDGRIDCTSAVAALQMKVTVQKKMGTRWVNVGTPAQGARYDVIAVWGTAYVGFSHGVYRTKSTGKVLFYGSSVWRPISAVSGPRSA